MRWTGVQDRFLEEHSNYGASWCAEEMERLFGIERSPQAVARHGSRIGVSFRRYWHCGECGKPIAYFPRDGVCRECSARLVRDRQEREYREALENQPNMKAITQYRREAAKYRQRRHRMKTS